MEYMNPSYDNNSVGNFNSGGMNPGGVVGANQPVMPMQQPISSGTDDIILSGDGTGLKSKKGLIISVIVALVVAVVIGVVVALMNSGIFAKSEQEKESNLAAAFNSFANYVMYGEESTEKVNFSDISSSAPYFMDLAYDEREEYIEKAQEKYDNLEAAYYEYMGYDENGELVGIDEEEVVEEENNENESNDEDEILEMYKSVYGSIDGIDILESYYVDYASVEPFTEEELVDYYTNNGIIATRDLVDKRYQIFDYAESNEYLNMLFYALKNYWNKEVDYIVGADNNNCISDKSIIENCYSQGEEGQLKFQTELSEVINAQTNFYSNTVLTMESLYYLTYGVDDIRYGTDSDVGQDIQSEQEDEND